MEFFQFLVFDSRIAVMKTKPTDFCSNVPHLIGDLLVKKRHLEKLGYHVILVNMLCSVVFCANGGNFK